MMIKDIICPHGWSNCAECANVALCINGMYPPRKKTVEKKEIKSWLDMFGRYPIPSLLSGEVMPLDGPVSPGGGSKSKCSKSKKGNKPTVYVWEKT